MVGARPVALRREEGVQRVHPDERAAGARRGLGGLRERGEVADALVARTAKGVQVRGEAEPAVAIAQPRGQEAAARRDEEPAGFRLALHGDRVGARREGRQRHEAPGDAATVGRGDAILGAGGRVERHVPREPVLRDDAQGAAHRPARGPGKRHAQRLAFQGHLRAWKAAQLPRGGERGEALAGLAGRRRAEPHRVEQRMPRVVVDAVFLSRDVVPGRRDARRLRESLEHGRLDAAAAGRRAGLGLLHQDHHRSCRHGLGRRCGRRRQGIARQRRVHRASPAVAVARVGPADRDRLCRGVEGERHAIGRPARLGRRVKRGHERPPARVRPVLAGHRAAVGVAPFDVRDAARVDGLAGKPAVGAQGAVFAAQRGEVRDEGGELEVGAFPVEPRERVVLRVRVVVAALRPAELVSHGDHGRAAGNEQRGEEAARIAPPGRDDLRVVRRPLDAVVPRMVRVGAVAVALAVGLVALVPVGDEVGEREAVVRADEVHRARRRSPARGEHVRGAREPRGELSRHPLVAAPEAAHRVAVAVVPFAPAGGEGAEAMAAGPQVPRLRDELEVAQVRVLGDGLQQGCGRVEAVRAARERGGEVEAEAVDAGGPGVVAQGVHRQANDGRAVQGEGVAASGIVRVMRAVAVERAVVGRVVQPAQRQRGPERVALAGVVEHDVEQHLEARLVQARDAGGELRDAAGREPRVGRHQRDGVVAPVVGEPQRTQVPLVHPRGDGHQLDGRDAQAHQVLDGRGMGEAGAGPADRLRDRRVGLRVAAHVQLVEHGVAPRDAGAAGRLRLRRRKEHGPRHEGRAVRVVARRAVRHLAELGRMQGERAVEGGGVRVDQELGRVEAMAVPRIVGAVRPQSVPGARAEARDEAVEHVAGALRQRDALDLGLARRVEQAQLDGARVRGEDRDVGPARQERDPERLGTTGGEGAHGGSRLLPRPAASRRPARPRGRGRAPRTASRDGASPRRSPSRAAASRRQVSRIAPEACRALEREGERLARDRGELQPVARARDQRHLVRVDHRVGEAAHARDHGNRAVAQRAQLGEPAGLEARGHHERVRAALHEVRGRLVEADEGGHAARMGRDGRANAGLERRLACADERRAARRARPGPARPRAGRPCPSAR